MYNNTKQHQTTPNNTKQHQTTPNNTKQHKWIKLFKRKQVFYYELKICSKIPVFLVL
jgi:hypothetical protein